MLQRIKRLLEQIFIFCAMPMAFSKCVLCYHQVLIMQLNCTKFKSSALLALTAFHTLPKALLEQTLDHLWSKNTTCCKKRDIIYVAERMIKVSKIYAVLLYHSYFFFLLEIVLFEYD